MKNVRSVSFRSTISNGSTTCEGSGNGPGRRWQVGLLLGLAVLCLLFVAVDPITMHVVASSKLSKDWSEPRSGWLYVLDPDVGNEKSVVWLVDPRKGIKGRLEAGYAPFFALSPDGTRLYVSSGQPGPTGSGVFSDELWEINTASGVVLQQVKLSDRLSYTLPGPGGLAVSPDGRYVYVAKTRSIRPSVDEETIQTFDTIKQGFLPKEAGLSGCGYPEIIPVSGDWQLVVKCSRSGVRLINLAADGSVQQSQSAGQRLWQGPLAQISPSPDARKLALIMNTGEIYEAEIGVSPFRINPTRSPRLSQSHRVLHTRVSPRSSDGTVFVSCASKELVSTTLTADEIHIFDTQNSWTRGEIIKVAAPCSDLILSANGRYLYGISPEKRTLLTINLGTRQVETSVGGIGVKPRFLAIAP